MPRGPKKKPKVDHRRGYRAKTNGKLARVSPGPSSGSEAEGNLRRLSQVVIDAAEGQHSHQPVTEQVLEDALARADNAVVDEAVLLNAARRANLHNAPSTSSNQRRLNLDEIMADASDSGEGN